MTCREVEDLLDAYADRELDVVRSREVEQHVGECPGCAEQLKRLRAMSLRLRSELPYHRVPESLQRRIGGTEPALSPTPLPSLPAPARHYGYRTGWLATAAVLLLGVTLGWSIATWQQSSGRGNLVVQDVVSAHIHSLMVSHLADVPSSDQHTVKPWFEGKVDFAPPVVDLADKGFPLTGGRLDYVCNRPVAALVYRYRQHPINLFVWPTGPNDRRARVDGKLTAARDGYNVIHWSKDGMEYWAVSDASEATLHAFVDAAQAAMNP